MSIYVNLANRNKIPDHSGAIAPVFDGSIIYAYGVPSHQVQRGKTRIKQMQKLPHLQYRMFDPQLYLADLDYQECSNVCIKLSSYKWFGINVMEFNSGEMKMSDWKKDEGVLSAVSSQWTGQPMSDPKEVEQGAIDCINFQRELGCAVLIAPAPTTYSTTMTYQPELDWLLASKRYVKSQQFEQPLYASVVLTSSFFNSTDENLMRCLKKIADQVTTRGFDGVYFVFHQTGDYGDTKHCDNKKSLFYTLKFVNMLANSNPRPNIVVNGLGFFGLVCRAAGANGWGINYSRKLYRTHSADYEDAKTVPDKNDPDKLVSLYHAHPRYWTQQVMGDIGIHKNFDLLVKKGFLSRIADKTEACEDFLKNATLSKSVKNVDGWENVPSRLKAANEHFLRSCVKAEQVIVKMNQEDAVKAVQEWLASASTLSTDIAKCLRSSGKPTHVSHVTAWKAAFEQFVSSQ